MKNTIKILALSGLGFIMASCGTANDAYGNNYPSNYPGSYPNSNGGVYRTSDGTVYRQGEIYRDRNGNVYENGRIIRRDNTYGRPGVLSRSENTVYYPTTSSRKLPPGQAKKIYGGKATDYAPGQVKKRNRSFNDDRDWRDDDGKYERKDDRKFEKEDGKSDRKFKARNGKRKGTDK